MSSINDMLNSVGLGNLLSTMPSPPPTYPPQSLQMQQHLQNIYMQQAQSAAMQNQQGLGQYSTSMGVPLPGLLRGFKPLQEKDLSNEAFDTPVETLANLWLAKYGDKWVDRELVVDDEFFSVAARRLLKLHRMEEVTLHDVPKIVLRVQA